MKYTKRSKSLAYLGFKAPSKKTLKYNDEWNT